MPTLSRPSLSEGLAHHRRGEWELAEHIYRAILARQADDSEALHLLGVLALQRGRPQEAIDWIERAIAHTPNAAVFHGNLGEAYRACDRTQEAAECYQTALRLDPAIPNVAVNYGSLLMAEGRPALAKNLFRFALQHWPNSALAYNGLGNACRVLGHIEQALAHFSRAAELDPQLGMAHTNLGQLLLDAGRPAEALSPCREAVCLQPDSAAAHNNLGNVFRKLGQFTEAKACYTEALRLEPSMAMAHNNLGQVLTAEGAFDAAVPWFEQAARIAPDIALFRVNLAAALIERGEFAAAEMHVRTVLQSDPHDLDARFALGKLLSDRGRLEEAQVEYRALLRTHPEHPHLNYVLGQVLLELDQQEEAQIRFRAALRGEARFAPALSRLATLLGDKLPAEEEAALRRGAKDGEASDAERSLFLFGLAQVCDARGHYAEAAQHLERANALELAAREKRGQGYNPDAHVRFVDRLLSVFTSEFFAQRNGFGVDSERPVFIVGLPRSGTSLLEQVLASHSRVHGAGELRLARQSFEEIGRAADGVREARAIEALKRIDAETVRRLAGNHLHRLEEHNAAADRIIDKMPDNYMYLGFLALLFPQARFLHCRRDVRDVAVSCWMTQFQQIDWANDPAHLASRFAQYQRLMAHWRRVLPVPVLDVDYESVVEDLEATARGVLAFCGLNWEPACLEFHRTQRPVRTASVTQVRQSLYRRSVARWRHYEKALQPLLARLSMADAATSNQQDGPPAEVGHV